MSKVTQKTLHKYVSVKGQTFCNTVMLLLCSWCFNVLYT